MDDEKARDTSALERAWELGEAAAQLGFDWPDVRGALEKMEEEIGKLRALLDGREPAGADFGMRLEGELGDLAFALVNVARHLGVDPATALERTNRKFAARFAHVRQSAQREGRSLESCTLDEMELWWGQAKDMGL